MKTAADIETIREQARVLRKQQPDLFEYLAERDAALVRAVLHLAARVDDPEELTEVAIPFANLFETRSCRNRWFQPEGIYDELEIEVPESFRRIGRRAEWLCATGIRLRKTRLREMV
jgi:hypothetical protein